MEKGHFYVCGDCTMAEHVYQTLKNIIQKYGGMNESQVLSYMLSLRVSNTFSDISDNTYREFPIKNETVSVSRN